MRQFLTAQWSDLIMVNYQVDEDLLASRLPAGTELDLYRGQCFVSLVGFMFLDTRVKGFLVPGHINFEEVNLRFYVKRETETETRRGVVFMKEIVPRSAIAFIARVFYGEPYEQWKMSNLRSDNSVRYEWSRGECLNSMSVKRGAKEGVPSAGSHSEFIIEHYWGYTRRDSSRTDEYKVEHPKWELYHAEDPQINVDFEGAYGKEFSHLSLMNPNSVLLAAGSEVSVFKGKKISC
jgi:uncharacterized protein